MIDICLQSTHTRNSSPTQKTLNISFRQQMGHQRVNYHLVGGWGALRVDPGGGVRLWRALDRESSGGEVGVARIICVDEGRPRLSSTATLTVAVSDVNDSAPRLNPPSSLHVTEGESSSLLGVLTATDDDLWHLGHGPPFTFSLAPSNPTLITRSLTLKYSESEYCLMRPGLVCIPLFSKSAHNRTAKFVDYLIFMMK